MNADSKEVQKNVSIGVDCLPRYSYSLASKIPSPFRSVVVENNTDNDIVGLRVVIDSATDLLTDREIAVDTIPANSTVEIDCSNVLVDVERLLQLSEVMTDNLNIKFVIDDEVIIEDTLTIEFFAFDQWTGIPETLAAFVTPNHPAIAPILVKASQYLKEWTGSSALDGYQSESRDRARMQAAAIFRALQEQGIVYVGAPASFSSGQRVRMPDMVLSQHMATCLDFAILYAACLEAASLHPIIVVIDGHAFAGVWLEEKAFPEMLIEDASALANRCAKGVEEITFVECTKLASDSGTTFQQAEVIGRENLGRGFQYAVDVVRSRYGGILPLPTRIMGADGWKVEVPKADLGIAQAPEKSRVSKGFVDAADEKRTKKQLWERSLLDLSMHNNLLNVRYGQRAMPIFAPSIDDVEDALALSNDLIIAPKPEEFPDIPAKEAFSIIDVSEQFKSLLLSEFKEGRLRTAFTASALKKNLDNLFRSAKSSLEETGANTLFLTLGTLLWVDEKRGGQIRHAPIMLFPIEIVRKSAKAGYIIRLRDEDPVINISLIEMLRADYEIHVNGLDPLPLDEAGVDTRLVLNTFRHKVKDQPGWQVLESATIGLFSFGQFVMWNDIRSHEDALRKSPVVDSMLEGHLTWTPKPIDNAPVDPSELLLPIEADSSQLRAIKAALSDSTFVLHGPPGTGKSQTITAIIANALARGKKVLFVAEKMAALEVVERRLAALGLAPFCLEVHSTKATKNHVLEQIQAAAEIGPVSEVAEYKVKLAEARSLRARLDQYAEGVSKKNAAGLSLRDLISEYGRLSEEADPMDVGISFARGIASPSDFATKMNASERLVAAARGIAPTAQHPLHGLTGAVYTQSLRDELPAMLHRHSACVDEFEKCSSSLASVLGVEKPADIADCHSLDRMAKQVVALKGLPAAWISAANRSAVVQVVRRAIGLARREESNRAEILQRRNSSFFQLDVDEIKREWVDANSKGMLGRNRAVQRVVAKVALCSLIEVNASNIGEVVSELEDYKKLQASAREVLAGAASYLETFAGADGSYDWASVMSALNEFEAMDKAGNIKPELASAASNADAIHQCEDYSNCMKAFIASRGELVKTIGLPPVGGPGGIFENERQLCKRIESNMGLLRDWMAWNASASTANSLGLGALVGALETEPASERLVSEFKCGAYKAMCIEALDTTEGMNGFSAARFDETVRQYVRADRELRKLAAKQIYYEVASKSPNLTVASVANPNAAKLQKALRSRGRNVSIRSVLSETGDVVRALCPCFLMSPLSVAQYLEPGAQDFDLLIFDEASQLQTCKAVGPLSRAKNAVIVGDPRQMPPTSFFQGKIEGEDFEEVSDLESVLEDCLALNLPQTYLQWHYRSKHESLIAFSNKRFYEGRMLTFPSADDRRSRVQFVKVDGYFDRGGTRANRAEAEAIVKEIARRASDPNLAKQSVGVVTFNIPQQTLIDDLLQKAFADDPALEKWANAGEEKLFIKNLENVQGDERDVILFSITYAPDKAGKMSMNFGPINREGGWRRLNVAVTRARSGMVVFSAMEPTDIDLNRVSSMGPAALQSFLSYAKNGATGSLFAVGAGGAARNDDWICSELCRRLEQRGYKVVRNVGKSEFKVDIGVVNPKNPSSYLAAVLLDGETYGMAQTTRDREISQPQLLENLGWATYRVLALDWWNNPDAVVEKLTAFLEEAEANSPEPDELIGSMFDVASDVEPMGQVAAENAEEQEREEEPGEEQVAKEAEQAQAEESFDGAHADANEQQVKDERAEDEQAEVESDAASHEIEVDAIEPPVIEQDASEPRAQEPEPSASESVAVTKCLYKTAGLSVEPLSAEEFAGMNARELAASIDEVLAVEAPIELSLLVRRVSQAYGLSRAGSRVQSKCEQVLKYAKCKRVTQAGRVIVWRSDQDPKTYRVYRPAGDEADRRSADQVPLEEIATAAVASLSEGGVMTQDQLAKAASVELGYKRVAATIVDYMKRGISLAVRRGMVEKEGKLYRVATESAEPMKLAKAVVDAGENTELSGEEAVSQDRQFLLDTMRVFIEDGEVTLDEAATLKLWLLSHKSMADDPDFKQVFTLLDAVLEDGVVTPEESAALTELFDSMVRE